MEGSVVVVLAYLQGTDLLILVVLLFPLAWWSWGSMCRYHGMPLAWSVLLAVVVGSTGIGSLVGILASPWWIGRRRRQLRG